MERGTFFMIGFIVYTLALIILGWYVSRGQKDSDDFLLAGRGLPLFLTLGTTVATMVGTGSSMGAVGYGYTFGWGGMLYGVGGAVGILLMGFGYAKIRELRFMTMSEELSYYTNGSHLVKNVVAIMVSTAEIGWLGAHIIGGSMYLSWATGVDLQWAKIIIAVSFSIYVVIGGYIAVVWTDTIQAIVLFIGFILMAILAVNHAGGWDTMMSALDPATLTLFGTGKLGVMPALSLAVVIGMGVVATPAYHQRIYTGKDVKAVRNSFVFTGLLYLCFAALPAIIGMATYATNPGLPNSNYAFPTATNFLPMSLALIVLIAGLSATMSSASSDAITAASIMLRDVYTLVTGSMPRADRSIFLSRLFSVAVIAVATFFALFSNDIIGYIGKMVSTLMSGLFACTILGRWWLRYNQGGALATLVGGSAVSVLIMMNPAWLKYWGNPCIPAIAGAFALGIIFTLLTPPDKLTREQGLEIITRERETRAQ